jgi:replicative DNA helicase
MKHMGNEDVERAWLNALATVSASEPEAGLKLIEASRVRAEDFSRKALADVYLAASDFLARGVPLELFALEAALVGSAAVKAAGGRSFLSALLMSPPSVTGGAPEHARLIRDASLRRRGVEALRQVAKQLQDPTSTPVEALAAGALAWSGLVNQTPGLSTSEQDVFRLGEMLDAAQSGRRELVIPSGIKALDAEIGGLQPGVLTLIGALPGVGKSALLATIVRNVANAGRAVGLFSLEDERSWVAKRMLSLQSRVPLFLLATTPLTKHQMELTEAAAEAVYKTLSKVIIDDRLALGPAEVAQTSRDMIVNHGAKVIVVDHLGEMRMARSERYDLDIAEALSAMRDVAKRHNVPVIVASHVKRRQGLGIENEPSLTDFANSSAPERMARVALGLSKPDKGQLRVSILKQTNGKSGHSIDLAMHESAAMVDSEKVLAPPTEADDGEQNPY